MKVTAQSIAKECGVSRGTVDRVVNGRPGVAPEVRSRVEQAISRAGYRTPKARHSQSEIKAALLIPHWEFRYYISEMQRGAKRVARYAAGDGFRLIFEQMHSRTTREYLECIEKLLTQNVRGIVLNASDLPTIRQEIDRLDRQGVKVVTYDSDVRESCRICHVGQDHTRSGRIAAGLMQRIAPTGDMLVVTGNSEFSTHRDRVNGFCSRMAERGIDAPHCQIIECLERYDLTFDGVLREIRANPRIRGIYMATESVDACVAALSRAKLTYPVKVVCNDLTPWSREYLLDGRVDFVIHQDFARQAERSVMILYELLCKNRHPVEDVEYIATSIISREMVEDHKVSSRKNL